MIEIDELAVRFGNFTAVDGLSLSVRSGELFGFLGPNGAGKTTTIRVLTGALRPHGGTVCVAGCMLPRELGKLKPLFGYVSDADNHYEDLTGRQNLALYARLYGCAPARVAQMLDTLELAEAADLKVGTYSRGMRKKLLIARELLHRPRIVFFDEPTSNLDAHSVALVRRLLRELTGQGVTVFLTTHDMEEVEQVCDRVAIIARGRLLDCDTPAAFIARHARPQVEARYDLDGRSLCELFDMDQPAARDRLAGLVRDQRDVRLRSLAFGFADVFRKLTGQAWQ